MPNLLSARGVGGMLPGEIFTLHEIDSEAI